MFELVELVGERLNLLHLVVDHLDELRDSPRGVQDGLRMESWIVNDPLSPCGHVNAKRHKRECDELFHGVSFVFSLFAGRRRHAASHAKGLTTKRRSGGVSRAQNSEKSVEMVGERERDFRALARLCSL